MVEFNSQKSRLIQPTPRVATALIFILAISVGACGKKNALSLPPAETVQTTANTEPTPDQITQPDTQEDTP